VNIPTLDIPAGSALDTDARAIDISVDALNATSTALQYKTAQIASHQVLLPLVVDLDGTLTATDTLMESLIQVVKRNPLNLVAAVFMLTKGRATFKAWVAAHSRLNASVLPYRQDVVAYLKQEKERGRIVVLATAAHKSIAEKVFAHFQFFDAFISTDGETNLKGSNKLAAIKRLVGDDFVYAGDSAADLPIWREARGAIIVSASAAVTKRAGLLTEVERVFPREPSHVRVWLKALRVHQWLKNVLLFVPLLTAFSFFSISDVLAVAAAFLCFSMAASATYILNDLWDLESDRQHPRKRLRPFANAALSISEGLAASAVLLSAAVLIAVVVSKSFLVLLVLYVFITSTYSYVLKSYMLLDVLTLSLLYTLRILAGAAALNMPTSQWLLAFSMFVFLSLALVKRCSELIGMKNATGGAALGRDYHVGDLSILLPMGVGTTASSIVIFALFIQSPETQARYLTPAMLWVTAFFLCYWLFRLWIKTARGEMHDDPIVYAIVDRGSRLTMLGIVGTMLLARFVVLDLRP
jgi:4-hydroxybenzoate polyprenyltransferase/phosphoserine phosphatase